MSVCSLLAVALLLSAATGCGRQRWEVAGARLIGDEKQPVLLLHLKRRRPGGRGGGSSHELLTCLETRRGTVLGKYDTGDWLKPYGLAEKSLWVRQGGVRSKEWVSFSLPQLERLHSFEHPPSQESRGWNPQGSGALSVRSCDFYPAVPRQVAGELLLDGAFVCDNQRQKILDLGGGDRLVAYQDLEKQRGKLLLGRLRKDLHWAWKTGERELFGKRPRKEHGYRVAYATKTATHLILVLQQADRAGDAWAVAIKPDSGKKAWAVHYR